MEYRLRETERANNSASLEAKFPQLKSLMFDLAYFDMDGVSKNGELRYRVNVQNAKSVFLFACRCAECVGGDFDLSGAVADAVESLQKVAEGELQCKGWRTRADQEKVPCHNLLRYKVSLSYA